MMSLPWKPSNHLPKGGADKKLDQILVREGVRTVYSREEKVEVLEAFLAKGLTMAEGRAQPGWPSRATLSDGSTLRRAAASCPSPSPSRRACGARRAGALPRRDEGRAVALYERGPPPCRGGAPAHRLQGRSALVVEEGARIGCLRASRSSRRQAMGSRPRAGRRGRRRAGRGRREVAEAALGGGAGERLPEAVLADLKAGGWGRLRSRTRVEVSSARD